MSGGIVVIAMELESQLQLAAKSILLEKVWAHLFSLTSAMVKTDMQARTICLGERQV